MPICYGVLALDATRIYRLTPYELLNMYEGYRVRQRQQENMLAQLVTLWIANTAGKTMKRELTLNQIFKDGRFKTQIDSKELQEILHECYE